MNVGSQAGDHPLPRLAVYAASKRFMDILSRGLSMDERYYTPTNVGFMYLSVGQVATKLGIPPSFWGPDADTFAKAVVDRVGCGRVRIAPYVGHAITEWSSDILPGRLEEIVLARFMKQFMKQMFLGQGKKVE
jgi:17beta-estradiol 17-dehydrogenase / very-long-chain 3-oxoacyl-CoA reductase